MGDEMLASVCELAFDVAKEGDAPSAMKNYLYLAQRPPRAYSVAQRALEESSGFRARVAERATIENVGEAGYLWLHRPAGWEERFSELNAGVESISSDSGTETPLAERPPMPAVPSSPQPTPATQIPSEQQIPAEQFAEAPKPERVAGASSTVSSIENELASLRGLVDRLADERQNVRSSVSELEVELETRRAENIEMFTKLSALRNELTTVQSSESTILLDRDRALARITELEADVARLTAEVDRLAAEAAGSSSEHQAALTDLALVSSERDGLSENLASVKAEHAAAVEQTDMVRKELGEVAAQRDNLQGERDRLQGELDAVTTDRNSLSGQFQDTVAERDRLQGELDAVTTDRNSVTGQFESTLAERDRLQSALDSATADLGELRSQLATIEGERTEMAARLEEMDQVRNDNADMASRLSVAEQARIDLEGQLEDVSEKWKASSRQLSVFENVNSQLDTAVAERDALQEQLGRTNAALTELHERIGTSHDQIRSELTTIESTFGDVELTPLAAVAPAADEDVTDDAAVDPVAEADASEDEVPDSDSTESSAPDTDIEAADVSDAELPSADVAVEDLDVPAFGDSVDFGTEIDADVESDDAEAEYLDPEGIEMDPTMLGGRTIGDMFGGNDDSTEAEIESVVSDESLNGNTSPDAEGLDELIQAAADEPASYETPSPEAPSFETPSFEAPSFEAPSFEAPSFEAPSFETPSFEAPSFDTPSPDAPSFDPLSADSIGDDLVADVPVADIPVADEVPSFEPVADEAPAETPVVDADPVAGSARRKLSIAPDLDGAAFARQVVESPDVVLLIDGDGTAGLGWPHLDVATRRGALVDYLGTLTAETGAAADVVFARPVGGEDALPVSRAVRVRIADAAVADSPIFTSIVDGYPREWPIAIVTNEPTLVARADSLEVTVLSNDQLLDLFLDLNSEG